MFGTKMGNAGKVGGAMSVVASLYASLYHLPLYLSLPHPGGQRANLAFGGTKPI